MKTNLTGDKKPTADVSIINFETLFDSTENDFSGWEFYDNSMYDSAFNISL